MGADFMFAASPQPKLNDERKQAIHELLGQISYEDLLKHFAQEDYKNVGS